MGVLKNSAEFSGKHMCWSLFLIKLKTFNKRKDRSSHPEVFYGKSALKTVKFLGKDRSLFLERVNSCYSVFIFEHFFTQSDVL